MGAARRGASRANVWNECAAHDNARMEPYGCFGTNKRPDYLIGTSETDDGLTHFSTVSGETRIYGGAIFEFQFKHNVDLFTDADFALLSADTYYGLGMYEGTGELTYLNQPDATPLPAALPLFATGLGALGLLGWRRKRKAA
jgi:hypothetical protein